MFSSRFGGFKGGLTASSPVPAVALKFSRADCQEWIREPSINPQSGREITPNGPTWKKLEYDCRIHGLAAIPTLPSITDDEIVNEVDEMIDNILSGGPAIHRPRCGTDCIDILRTVPDFGDYNRLLFAGWCCEEYQPSFITRMVLGWRETRKKNRAIAILQHRDTKEKKYAVIAGVLRRPLQFAEIDPSTLSFDPEKDVAKELIYTLKRSGFTEHHRRAQAMDMLIRLANRTKELNELLE